MEGCKITVNELAYSRLLSKIYQMGGERPDRTGTGTYSTFGEMLELNLQESFPVLSAKSIHMKSCIGELIWILSGSTNIEFLKENNIRIWNEWADEYGEVGKMYGYQMRNWEKFIGDKDPLYGTIIQERIDQLANVIKQINIDPHGRRHIVTMWNPSNLLQQALPCCHILFQFYVRGDKLDCMVYQRSADMFLGVPFDIVLYALLTHIVAGKTNLKPGKLKFTFGDTHIYKNHIEQVTEYLKRVHDNLELNAMEVDRPEIEINHSKDLNSFTFEDFNLMNYNPLPKIPAKVSV